MPSQPRQVLRSIDVARGADVVARHEARGPVAQSFVRDPGPVLPAENEWMPAPAVVTASYDGGRGHPLVLGREDWIGIPDEGLRNRPVHLVPCDDLGAPGDVDRPEDLPKL